MSEDEFWYSTPRFLQARIKAKQRDDRETWVQARQIAYWSILPHLGKKRLKPQDLAKFAWERGKTFKHGFKSQAELLAHLKEAKEKVLPFLLEIERAAGKN